VTISHDDDLALARACADGDEAAWERFVAEYRPILYRAAAAIDPAGGGRELADAIYGDLFGVRERDGKRQSLFQYFQGRSSLATWLRAVLAQRHVDAIRARRRTEPLPDDESLLQAPAEPLAAGTERSRYLQAMQHALTDAIAALPARDRLRLKCYYIQNMKLAAIGTLLREHEGTVSRHLTRTKGTIREAVKRCLLDQHGMSESAVAECFSSVTEDPGTLDLCKIVGPDRSDLERE
jgi:RNA polymerase sigma-70 factor (ECF subfamily)